MKYVTLGRTGLKASVAGLGCGGYSRLGQAYGNSVDQSVAVIEAAMDHGVNFIDTAAVYGTEEIVGKAVAGRRDQVIISSKHLITKPGTSPLGSEFLTGAEYAKGIEGSLKRLGTDYIDIYHPHGVTASQYDYCVNEIIPVLKKMKTEGKIRHVGLTERFIYDPGHDMLKRALADEFWDVVMTGFNLINHSARTRVFPAAMVQDVGTLIMFAVRRALGSDEAILEIVGELIAYGSVDPALINADDPLDFLKYPAVANDVIEAAYRFCRHEPGAHVTLTGTGSIPHLLENLASIQASRLPDSPLANIEKIFGTVDHVSGN